MDNCPLSGANGVTIEYDRGMAARVQLSFKVAEAGIAALEKIGERVGESGHARPNRSEVARAALAEVMSDPKLRDRVFARLLTQGPV